MMTDKQPINELKADEINSDMNMPEEMWLDICHVSAELKITEMDDYPAVKYIRADIHEALKAENERLLKDADRMTDWNAEKALIVLKQAEEIERLRAAASNLIDGVKRRYPNEDLRCPYMIALQQALQGKEGAE